MISDADDIILDADKAAAELCKRKLSFFVKEFWDEIIEDELEWAPHMDVLCDEIQKVYDRVFVREVEDEIDGKKQKRKKRLPKLYDLIINIPPGTSKSTICTIMAPAWSWTRDPSLRHITGSFDMSLSTGHAVKSRDIVRSAKYRRYFPDVEIKKDQDNKTDYWNTKNGQRFVTSVGASPTGVHAHIITIDDPLNPKQAASEADIEAARKFFDETITTRKVDKRVTPMILIMQRLHVKDPTGHLLEKKKSGLRHICLPGTISENVRPLELKKIYSPDGLLDPDRLGPKQLEELKIDLGSYGYAGQVDQTPVPAGGLIWQKWFNEIPDYDFPLPEWGEDHSTDWDLAYTEKESNSACAYVTSFTYRGGIYIDDIGWDWKEFPELVRWMRTKVSPHYIEQKASGKSAKQTLTRMGITAIEYPVTGGDKEARARMATPIAESGRVFIRRSLVDRLYNDSKQGILFFPRGQFTDLADALAQCLQRRKGGGVRMMGDSSQDDLDELMGDEGAELDDVLDDLEY